MLAIRIYSVVKLCVLLMCRHQTGQHFRVRIERRKEIAVREVEKCEDQAR